MNKLFLIFASIAGAAAVLAGALLSHQLKQRMPVHALEVFETAVRYQFYHVFALLAVGLLSERFYGSWMNRAGTCFIAGILLFSGSLYVISLLMTASLTVPLVLGILTPLGGLAFILGWLCMSVAVLRGRNS